MFEFRDSRSVAVTLVAAAFLLSVACSSSGTSDDASTTADVSSVADLLAIDQPAGSDVPTFDLRADLSTSDLAGDSAPADLVVDLTLSDGQLEDGAPNPDLFKPDVVGGPDGETDLGLADTVKPPCPSDSVHVDNFCIDRYEAPNLPGVLPLAMQNALAGEKWCAERGKRLCTEAEWVRACEGLPKKPYPYGSTYKKGTCNDDETWISPKWAVLGSWPSTAAMTEAERLYQGEESGSNTGCVSQDGVYDLTGNVAEWVRRSFPHANNYDHVMKGCYWAGCFGGSPPSCSFTNPAHPSGFRSYEAGFRCCKDAL